MPSINLAGLQKNLRLKILFFLGSELRSECCFVEFSSTVFSRYQQTEEASLI